MKTSRSKAAALLFTAGVAAAAREVLFAGPRDFSGLAVLAVFYAAAGAVLYGCCRRGGAQKNDAGSARPPEILVGPMAAGIAHNFRNYLSVLSGSLAMLRRATFEGPGVQRALQIQEKCLAQAERMTTLLLRFARSEWEHDEERLMRIDTTALIDDAVELAEIFLRERKIELRRVIERNLPEIRGDETGLMQSLINVIKNAGEASPPGGVVEVAAALSDDGQSVFITVRDHGVGLEDQMRSRIFAPFASDKADGTGLGLFTVRALIEQSGGAVSINSERGAGTEVVIGCKRARSASSGATVQNPVIG
jgi:signal transduction histidine kinase